MRTRYLYNAERGSVEEWVDGQVRSMMMVRAAMEEAVLLEAVIVELERRGYRVTRNDGMLTWDTYGAARP